MERSATVRPSRLACVGCRQKHIKCDGVTPVCGRCSDEALTCNYTPSLRGLTRRRKKQSHAQPERRGVTRVDDSLAFESPRSTFSANSNASAPLRAEYALARPPIQFTSSISEDEQARLINLFYSKFYHTHPILVPQASFAAQGYPDYLCLVLCFIGQHYGLTNFATASIHDAVSAAMNEAADTPSVHRVQALVLFAIVLHARHQTRAAETCLARAGHIAVDLGMNDNDFPARHGGQDVQVEESLRRTWWELYTVDVYMAALHRRTTVSGCSVQALSILPNHQSDFESGRISGPVTLATFEARVFALEHTPSLRFSSYCYRIEASRIVKRVLDLAASENAEADDVQSVDNAIASWKYHLPNCGTDVVDASGEIDSILFQAHFMIHCASIFLHFPRSDLPPTVPSVNDITCARGYTQLAPTSKHHTIKAIAASKEISNLAAIPAEPSRYSPFFTCALILGCIVQLAAASIHLHTCGTQCLQQHRDRVVLMIGVLKPLSNKWAIAQNALNQIRIVASAVFTSHGSAACESSCGSISKDSGIDLEEIPTNASWFDLFSPAELSQDLLAFPSVDI